MLGRRDQESSPDTSRLNQAGQDEAIARFVERQKAKREAAGDFNLTSTDAPFSEELVRQATLRRALKDMAKDADKNRPYTVRYHHTSSRYEHDGEVGRAVKTLVGLGVAGLAYLIAPGYVADSNYGSEAATEFLEGSGYSEVKLTDTSRVLVEWEGCGDDDDVKYSFEATSANGVDNEVIVCKGMFKGATIRD